MTLLPLVRPDCPGASVESLKSEGNAGCTQREQPLFFKLEQFAIFLTRPMQEAHSTLTDHPFTTEGLAALNTDVGVPENLPTDVLPPTACLHPRRVWAGV